MEDVKEVTAKKAATDEHMKEGTVLLEVFLGAQEEEKKVAEYQEEMEAIETEDAHCQHQRKLSRTELKSCCKN